MQPFKRTKRSFRSEMKRRQLRTDESSYDERKATDDN